MSIYHVLVLVISLGSLLLLVDATTESVSLGLDLMSFSTHIDPIVFHPYSMTDCPPLILGSRTRPVLIA